MKFLATAATIALAIVPAKANIISTIGLTQVTAPSAVTANFVITDGLPTQLIFPERQNITLAAPLTTDTGVIPAGTIVDSYLFAVNSAIEHIVNTSATFNGPVLGLIYKDVLDGSNVYVNPGPFNPHFAASNFLGAVGTSYDFNSPACGVFCGFEIVPAFDTDTASFAGDTASFHNDYSVPGDFARIIVQPAAVPGPIVGVGLPGFLAFFAGLGIWWQRRVAT